MSNEAMYCANCGKKRQENKGRIIDGSISSDIYYTDYKFKYVCSYYCYVELLFKKKQR